MKKVSKIIVISLLAFIVMTAGMFSAKVMASGLQTPIINQFMAKLLKYMQVETRIPKDFLMQM
ncbi:hypothetical protein [Clostridium ljungdahlii]|uniref:hypothetical protein n=1 Tax=Clostridium ljungdahlii TaxID=1538 RepID=UPI00386F84E4